MVQKYRMNNETDNYQIRFMCFEIITGPIPLSQTVDTGMKPCWVYSKNLLQKIREKKKIKNSKKTKANTMFSKINR